MRGPLLSTFVVATIGLAGPALAQDPVKTDPDKYKVVAENERVRVLKATLAAGAKTKMHEHPDTFVTFLNDVNVRHTMPDGTAQDRKGAANEVLFIPAGKHQSENLGAAIEVMIVELKGAGKKAATTGAPAAPPARAHETSTTLVTNDRGNAVRLKVEPGFAEAAGSTHDWDTVVVPITHNLISLTMGGKTTMLRRGEAYLIPKGTAHHAKAAAAGEATVIRIQ